jgi:hypothetical protein
MIHSFKPNPRKILLKQVKDFNPLEMLELVQDIFISWESSNPELSKLMGVSNFTNKDGTSATLSVLTTDEAELLLHYRNATAQGKSSLLQDALRSH